MVRRFLVAVYLAALLSVVRFAGYIMTSDEASAYDHVDWNICGQHPTNPSCGNLGQIHNFNEFVNKIQSNGLVNQGTLSVGLQEVCPNQFTAFRDMFVMFGWAGTGAFWQSGTCNNGGGGIYGNSIHSRTCAASPCAYPAVTFFHQGGGGGTRGAVCAEFWASRLACSTHLQQRSIAGCEGSYDMPECQAFDLRNWMNDVLAFTGTASFASGDYNLQPNANWGLKFPSSTWREGDRFAQNATHETQGKIDWAWYHINPFNPQGYGWQLSMNYSDHHAFTTYK